MALYKFVYSICMYVSHTRSAQMRPIATDVARSVGLRTFGVNIDDEYDEIHLQTGDYT